MPGNPATACTHQIRLVQLKQRLEVDFVVNKNVFVFEQVGVLEKLPDLCVRIIVTRTRVLGGLGSPVRKPGGETRGLA